MNSIVNVDGKDYLNLIQACKEVRVKYNSVKWQKFPFEHKGYKFRKEYVKRIEIDPKTKERTLILETDRIIKL